MADNVGNRLGARAVFVYSSDTGQDYNISLDESVSEAVGNPRSTQALLPVLPASQSRPIRPRYFRVQLQSDPKVTKNVICCDATALNWVNSNAATITINGVAYTITGRIGEARSALRVDEAPI